MIRRSAAVLALVLLIGGAAWAQQPAPIRVPLQQQVPDFLGWVEDELIVVFRPEALSEIEVVQELQGPWVNDGWLRSLLAQYDVQRFHRQFASARSQPLGSPYPDLTGHYKMKIGAGRSLDAAVSDFEDHPFVDHVERIGIHSLSETPNDPFYQDSPNSSFPHDQWHYWATHGIGADLAWDLTTGSSDVLVGILDSGIRYFHIDLGGDSAQWGPGAPFAGGNIFINAGEVPGNGIDDDGNGYVDDTIGYDFVTDTGGFGVNCIDQDCGTADNDPDDGNGHGTHVGGTVGAITNNNRLVAGVAGGFSDGTSSGAGNGVSLVPMRIGYHATVFGQVTGVVRMDWAAEAMNYLADLVDRGHNVAAVNCSWGSSDSGGLSGAVDNLLAHDVMVVHAAGNSNSSSPDFLGAKAGVMNVAATDINGNGASFTNFGSWVDVAAPGVDIVSTYRNPDDPDPGAHYIALLSGTSMSAPHICGIAALLESCNPALSGTDKFNLIVGNTTPYTDSRDLGTGIANARLALDASCGTACDLSADFTGTPTSGCAPLDVTFTDLSTGTSITSWSWDFGDGNTSTSQNPTHSYASAGTYSVSLTVTNADCSDSMTKSGLITVQDVPIADFSGTPTSGTAPLTVQFTDLSSGNASSWSWDFGDGGTSTAQNPSYTYQAAGTYSVTLTASNGCGNDTVTKTGYIVVDEPQQATTMHVDSIVLSVINGSQGQKTGAAQVTVVDENGSPVANASVTGTFSGDFSGTTSAVTNGSGVATLTIGPKKGRTNFSFCVDDVTHGSLTYAPADNVETCDSN